MSYRADGIRQDIQLRGSLYMTNRQDEGPSEDPTSCTSGLGGTVVALLHRERGVRPRIPEPARHRPQPILRFCIPPAHVRAHTGH